MAYDRGYGELENCLIDLFYSEPPDFEAAEVLIRQGADVNAVGKDDDENILSEIIGNHNWSKWEDEPDEEDNASERGEANPRRCETLCEVIRFFLAHGFDVHRREGCFGAQCLFALTLSTFDRRMIEATKLLLAAGAENRTISLDSTDIYETPMSFIGTEGSFQDCLEHNHALANIYEATYQIYLALEDGRPWQGIDSYEIAVGKRIQKVLIERDGDHPAFFSLELPGYKKDNCYRRTLYFVYDGGVLISTRYADLWTDTVLPTAELIDVSAHFPGIAGHTILGFSYDSRTISHDKTGYTQPIAFLEMDSGYRLRLSINFGEVEDVDRAAYFELMTP